MVLFWKIKIIYWKACSRTHIKDWSFSPRRLRETKSSCANETVAGYLVQINLRSSWSTTAEFSPFLEYGPFQRSWQMKTFLSTRFRFIENVPRTVYSFKDVLWERPNSEEVEHASLTQFWTGTQHCQAWASVTNIVNNNTYYHQVNVPLFITALLFVCNRSHLNVLSDVNGHNTCPRLTNQTSPRIFFPSRRPWSNIK